MNKITRTLFLAALFVSLLIVSVAYHSAHPSTRVGDVAPALSFDSKPSDALRALKGKYVLLCFWSAGNAPSREQVGMYSSWVERDTSGDVGLIAYNFDKSEPLFREIVKRDGLNQELQFRLSDAAMKKLMRDYGLKSGSYGTLLIAPDGRIVAHNPAPEALPKLTDQ